MEETIKFETAKLAEEKGYKFEYIGDTLVSVPTQSALQKWLRETHNIHITINFYTHVEIQMPVWDPERNIEIPENPDPLNLKFDDTTAHIYVNNR